MDFRINQLRLIFSKNVGSDPGGIQMSTPPITVFSPTHGVVWTGQTAHMFVFSHAQYSLSLSNVLTNMNMQRSPRIGQPGSQVYDLNLKNKLPTHPPDPRKGLGAKNRTYKRSYAHLYVLP